MLFLVIFTRLVTSHHLASTGWLHESFDLRKILSGHYSQSLERIHLEFFVKFSTLMKNKYSHMMLKLSSKLEKFLGTTSVPLEIVVQMYVKIREIDRKCISFNYCVNTT